MNLPKLRKRFSFRWTNSFATSRSRILSVLALWVCNKATLLKRCCFMLARNHVSCHSSCHGKRSLTCSTCDRIYQQEFRNNNKIFFQHYWGGGLKPPQLPQLRGPCLCHKDIFNGYQNIDAKKKIEFAHLWDTTIFELP